MFLDNNLIEQIINVLGEIPSGKLIPSSGMDIQKPVGWLYTELLQLYIKEQQEKIAEKADK